MHRVRGMASVSMLVLALAGCASTGPPRAPSLDLPQTVRDLAAERFGNHVDLHWTVPTLTTDRQPLRRKRGGAGPLTAEVCRIEAGSTCLTVAHFSVIAGEVASTRDVLSAPLTAGEPRLLQYRVRVLNEQGRSAEWSRDADVAAGKALPAVTALSGVTTDRGIQLTWQRQASRPGQKMLLKEQIAAGSALPEHAKTRVLSVDGDPGGTVDPDLAIGTRAIFTLYRSAAISLQGADVVLNGDPATVTVTRQRDTFAPAVPAGLLAVSVQLEAAAPEIDLSWEPDTEADLLGYFVYRAEAGSTVQPQRLTPTAVTVISYRDFAVSPGRRYRYSVSAVDRSGNESAKSVIAEESLRP